MAIYHDTHTERLATNDKDKPRIIGDVTIHPTAQVHPTAVVSTVKPAHKVTCIKRSPFSCPLLENFKRIEPLLRGHLSYKATFSLTQM